MGASEVWLPAVVWLLTYAVHSTLLLGAAWLVTGGLPERLRPWRSLTPRWNERVWKLALVGGLITASAQQAADLEPFGGRWTVGPAERAEQDVARVRPQSDAAGSAHPSDRPSAEAAGRGEPRRLELSCEVDERRELVLALREPNLFLRQPAEAETGYRLAGLTGAAPGPDEADGAEPRASTAGSARSRFGEARTPRERFGARVLGESGGVEETRAHRAPGRLPGTTGTPRTKGANGHAHMGLSWEPAARLGADGSQTWVGKSPVAIVQHVLELRHEAPAAASVELPLSGNDMLASGEPPAGPLPGVALRSSWSQAGLGLWIAGAALGLLAFALGWSRLLLRLAGRHELEAGPLRARLDALCRKAGFRGRIRLTASSRLQTPITLGLFRREICVPLRVLRDLDGVQQEALLAHELAHAIRRDPAWLGLCGLLETLLFLQPLNRLARRELQHAAEFLCDDWAVRVTGRALPLASCLTAVAQWIVGERRALPAPGMVERGSGLRSRVERLLDGGPATAERWTALWTPSALAILVLVALAIPGFARAADPAPTTAGASAPRAVSPMELPAASAAEELPDSAVATFTIEAAPTPASTGAPGGPIGPTTLGRSAVRPSAADPAFALPVATSLGARPRTLVVRARAVQEEHGRVDELLAVLEDELEQLEQELQEMVGDAEHEAALEGIQRRLGELRSRRDRMNALIPRVLGILATSEEAETRTVPEQEDRP